ncbi:hypothetical protein GCM10011326_27630 [Salipiger profundus]|uniref:Uncharacterized protein n=1 Tax=Salipiger profundus TaxID=1229727 RepID=A0A1U7D542_9RHOB|nr:hypothetical protein Ga0080559_TMP2400 [Salipiger profundus]GGA13985.1 hypothetical protein GCM10011326_27630 [Salipiger profundus]
MTPPARYDATARISNLCGVTGDPPATFRAMTPRDTALFVAAWNAAQEEASGDVPAPDMDTLERLEERYGRRGA